MATLEEIYQKLIVQKEIKEQQRIQEFKELNANLEYQNNYMKYWDEISEQALAAAAASSSSAGGRRKVKGIGQMVVGGNFVVS